MPVAVTVILSAVDEPSEFSISKETRTTKSFQFTLGMPWNRLFLADSTGMKRNRVMDTFRHFADF